MFKNHPTEKSGKTLKGTQAGPGQYLWQWCYGIIEPTILRFSHWCLGSKIGGKLITPAPNKIMPKGIVLTTEAVCRFVDFIYTVDGPKGAHMGIGDCVCQTALHKNRPPKKKDMVLLYSADLYNNRVKTYSAIETAEEAKAYLRQFHEAGLIHNVLYCFDSGKWTFVLCNCDNEICVPLRLHLAGKPMLMPGPEVVLFDPSKCLGVEACGHCLKRCSVHASFAGQEKSNVDFTRCLGCGLCTSTCQGGARKMGIRDYYQHEDILTTKILLGMEPLAR